MAVTWMLFLLASATSLRGKLICFVTGKTGHDHIHI